MYLHLSFYHHDFYFQILGLCLQLIEHEPPFPYLFSALLSFAPDPVETSSLKNLRF